MLRLVAVLVACLTGDVYAEETRPVEEVCRLIQACDEAVCQELQRPGPLDAPPIFTKIRAYIDAVHELVKCLHRDKEGTVAVKEAKEIIDKKGARFVQDLPWTYRMAREQFGWDGRVIQDFLNWRMLTQEVWMDVEKYFDPTAYIPKEMYTEGPDDIVFEDPI